MGVPWTGGLAPRPGYRIDNVAPLLHCGGDATAPVGVMLHELHRPVGAVPPDALTPFKRDAAVDHYLRLFEDGS